MTPGIRTPNVPSTAKPFAMEHNPLYGLCSTAALAELLTTPLAPLWRIGHALNNYTRFNTRTGGKLRLVTAPRPPLELIQRRIYDYLNRIDRPSYLHSGTRGRSHVTNASLHIGQSRMCTIDLRSFYLQITTARVKHFFSRDMRCSSTVSALLTRLCTTEGHVPVGGCISQPLAFLVARPMFDELDRLARTRGIRFSAYVDDLYFSGDFATPSFLWTVKQVIHRYGFRYHAAKYYGPDDSRPVTGTLLIGDRMLLPPEKAARIHHGMAALRGGPTDERTLASLVGRLAEAQSVDTHYAPLLHKATAQLKRMRHVRHPSLVEEMFMTDESFEKSDW